MLDMNAIFHRNLFDKLNSQTSAFETTHLKQLLVNTFVIYTNFTPVISTKREPLHIGPYKKLKIFPMSPLSSWPSMVLHFTLIVDIFHPSHSTTNENQ